MIQINLGKCADLFYTHLEVNILLLYLFFLKDFDLLIYCCDNFVTMFHSTINHCLSNQAISMQNVSRGVLNFNIATLSIFTMFRVKTVSTIISKHLKWKDRWSPIIVQTIQRYNFRENIFTTLLRSSVDTFFYNCGYN